MIRLIGILTGAAIATGLLIVTLGIPEVSQSEPETALDGGSLPTIETVSAPRPEPAPAETGVPDPEPEPEPEPAPEPEPEPAPEPVPVASEVPATLTDEQLVDRIFAPSPGPALDEHWYAFWSPFRSEIAANGFVSRLQQTTGMDYRVVKLKPGVYEVAFAYTDEDDIDQKLALISAATGLDMSGG